MTKAQRVGLATANFQRVSEVRPSLSHALHLLPLLGLLCYSTPTLLWAVLRGYTHGATTINGAQTYSMTFTNSPVLLLYSHNVPQY